MKRFLFAISIPIFAFMLASCGKKETLSEEGKSADTIAKEDNAGQFLWRDEFIYTNADSEEEERKLAYGKLLRIIYQRDLLPGGGEIIGGECPGNEFALCDVDGNGAEELLIRWDSIGLGATSVYDYKDGVIREQLPGGGYYLFLYDNKTAECCSSSDDANSIRSYDRPHYIYRYEESGNRYVLLGFAYGFSSAENGFPTEKDLDGDGMLYRLYSGEDEEEVMQKEPIIVDGKELQEWRDGCIGDGKEIPLFWQKLTKKNIDFLGYPALEIILPEPKG